MSVTYPLGFRASGVTAGVKPSGQPDLGLLVGDPGTTAAALFTTSSVVAAPVQVGRDRVRRGRIRAVLVNSGQASAATGVIGEPLHVDRLSAALPSVVEALAPRGGEEFADANMTTDTVRKQANAETAGGLRWAGARKASA